MLKKVKKWWVFASKRLIRNMNTTDHTFDQLVHMHISFPMILVIEKWEVSIAHKNIFTCMFQDSGVATRVSSRNFGLGWKWVWHFHTPCPPPPPPLTIDIIYVFSEFHPATKFGGGKRDKWVGVKFSKALGRAFWEISWCLQTAFR